MESEASPEHKRFPWAGRRSTPVQSVPVTLTGWIPNAADLPHRVHQSPALLAASHSVQAASMICLDRIG